MNNNEVIDSPDYYLLPCGKYLKDFIRSRILFYPEGEALTHAWRAGKKHGESREKDLAKDAYWTKELCKWWDVSYEFADQHINRLLREAAEWDGKPTRKIINKIQGDTK